MHRSDTPYKTTFVELSTFLSFLPGYTKCMFSMLKKMWKRIQSDNETGQRKPMF